MSGGNMNKKLLLSIQLSSILIVVLLTLFFNVTIYALFTSKCEGNFGNSPLQAKIIEVEKYLPFDTNSKIYKLESNTKITGDLPVLDGATALLPVYSAIAHAIYPEESVLFVS